ncbi:MAG: hypothetical protein KGL35_19165 [Bradyrhizobium sp.]|nr:hypothetical protein [Bradyrhizobium sp.]
MGLMQEGDRIYHDGREYTVTFVNVPDETLHIIARVPAPKPYYVNAPGAEPKSGDVFISGSFVVAVRDNEYAYTHNNDTYVLRGPHRGASHGVGSDLHKRTLVVRHGKPWVA